MQIPPSFGPEHTTGITESQSPFFLDNFLRCLQTSVDDLLRSLTPKLLLQQLASNCPSRHFPSQVPGIIHKLQDGYGSIVSRTVTVLVYPRVSTWSFGISASECVKDFRQNFLFEEKRRSTGFGPPVRLFAPSNDLEAIVRRHKERQMFEITFSANLAVSLALGNVVLICSCSKSEVTKFLRRLVS